MDNQIPAIEELIKLFAKLPGLGPKSAKRIILKLINMASTSRLIVKNLPKHLKESELREHFKRDNKYAVTDAKIMFAGTKTRQFGFVGFKNSDDAIAA